MKKIKLKIFAFLLIVSVIGGLPLTAYANWYDEVSGGSYSLILGEPYVAETFCGVEARYSLTSAYYQCNELVIRFYKEAYGLDVTAYPEALDSIGIGGLNMVTQGYKFVTPDVPHPGDVIFAPAKFRNGKGDHWAIVKSYSGGKITLFEQNVVYNAKAGTGRTLNYPSNYYYIYTPQAESGYPAPVLKNAPAISVETTAPTTAPTAVSATVPTTVVSTTEAKTTVPATTAPTTVPVTAATTKLITTVVKSTTVKATERPAVSTTVSETESTTEIQVETTVPETEEYLFAEAVYTNIPEYTTSPEATVVKKSTIKPIIAIGVAVIAVIAVVTALIIIRKRNEV